MARCPPTIYHTGRRRVATFDAHSGEAVQIVRGPGRCAANFSVFPAADPVGKPANLTQVLSPALSLAIGFPAAYALARKQFRCKGLLMALYVLLMLVPPLAYGIALSFVKPTRFVVRVKANR